MISKATQKLIRQLAQKKYRSAEKLFVAEGPKVVGDLLRAGFKARQLFVTPPHEAALRETCGRDQSVGIETVTDDDIAKVSFLQHPQGVMGLFHLPPTAPLEIADDSLTLMLDGVQDPGNLGTIIRIADWFGIGQIVCSPDTADAFSPKVVQATMGSIARVHLTYQPLLPLLQQTPPSYPVYGTLLDGKNIYRQQLSRHGIVIMGNEGNGISEPIRKLITHPLLIPNFGSKGAESLNVAVATAITCSEFRRTSKA